MATTRSKRTARKATAKPKVPKVTETKVTQARVAKPKAAKTAKATPASTKAKALHRQALRHNWDDGLFRLERILADRACDLGTALLIYWLGAPGFDRQYVTAKDLGTNGWRRPVFTFLRKLEKRLLKRDFATASILFNPRFDRTTMTKDGHDWTAEYADIPNVRPIPEALKEPSCADPAWEKRGRAPIANTANRLT